MDYLVIIPAIISSLTSLAVVGITKLFERKFNKNKILIERMEKLYIPFYKKCLKGFLPESRTWTNRKFSAELVDLLMENVNYMNPKSQKLFKDFYRAYANRFCISPVSQEQKEEYDRCFIALAESLLQEYQTLSRKLKQVQPIKLF